MTDAMQLECRSLLLKLKLQQRNLQQLLPSENTCMNESIASDKISEFSDTWPTLGQNSSYARNKLKTLVCSPTDSSSLKSSFDEDVSLDSTSLYGYKPKVYLHKASTSNPKQYQRSSQRPSPRIYVADPGPGNLIKENPQSGNFLRDINEYLDDSRDVTVTTTDSDRQSDLRDFDNISEASTTTPSPKRKSEKISSLPTTPNTAQKRSLIDRNIPVTSKYDNFQFNTDAPELNFSYSTVDDETDEETFLKSRLNASPEDIFLKHDKDYKFERRLKEREEDEMNILRSKEDKKVENIYNKQLTDAGNDKNYLLIARESFKPRSILSSPGTRDSSKSKSTSRVSFKTSSSFNDSSLQGRRAEELNVTSRLMGYDWIAALLDNETGVMDESESYFRELKEFRRSNRDECCNDFYMNSPLTFAEAKEEEPVIKALDEPKVKPYIVNNRLFTEPLKNKLICDSDESNQEKESQPTQHSPRYVRVSIPRSTLEKPYKIKPHRRNSFDPTDSCSLREHCLMGWDNSRVSALPTASSVDINEATDGIKPRMTTTLAEAEHIARTGTTQMWPFLPPPSRVDPLPTWRKHYESSVMNLSNPASFNVNSTIPGDSDSLRKSTNSLLNSTYSMMYEMERLKRERESSKA